MPIAASLLDTEEACRGALESKIIFLPRCRSCCKHSLAPGYGAAPSINTPQISTMNASKVSPNGANRCSIDIPITLLHTMCDVSGTNLFWLIDATQTLHSAQQTQSN